MAEAGWRNPDHPTTTRDKSPDDIYIEPTLRYDWSYLRTIPGRLKIAEIFLDIFAYICIGIIDEIFGINEPSRYSFKVVVMTAWWVTVILLLLYMYHVVEKFYKVPWIMFDIGLCIFWACMFLLTLINMSLSRRFNFNNKAFTAAWCFGAGAMLVYGCDAFLKVQMYKTGQLAQRNRVINTQITTTVSLPSAGP